MPATATKTAAANLTVGMTIKVTEFRFDAAIVNTAAGETCWVPLGSITSASPTVTVATLTHRRSGKNLLGVKVTTTDGHVFSLSTRQKVEVLG